MTIIRKFQYPEAAALLNEMLGGWFTYNQRLEILPTNASIARGYHEPIWRIFFGNINEARDLSEENITKFVRLFLETGTSHASELCFFLHSIKTSWSKKLILKVAEAVFDGKPLNPYQVYDITINFGCVLSDDICKKGLAANHRGGFTQLTVKENREMFSVLNESLSGLWLINKVREPDDEVSECDELYLISKFVVLMPTVWKLIEKTDKGTLIKGQYGKYLLYNGRAPKVYSGLSTVDEAINFYLHAQ
jgi:hypothetical protein